MKKLEFLINVSFIFVFAHIALITLATYAGVFAAVVIRVTRGLL